MRPRPRPWSTGDAGSFAHRTLAVRVPRILDDTVARADAAGLLSEDARQGLADLRQELVAGRLRGLVEHAPDRASWDAACAPHLGHTWLDVPWYFAESFFYRRVLEATGFFRAGAPMAGVDPFLPVKRAEEAAAVPRSLPLVDARPPLRELLLAALWGNRADLSYTAGLAHGATGSADDLLVDDTAAAVPVLEAARAGRGVAVLLDNAGTELCFDLLLAGALGATLYAKAHPFFVSDATPDDVERTRAALGLAPLPVRVHPWLTSSGFFLRDEMPADLVEELARFDLVVVKGDANYRRLVGDAPWPHATPLDDATDFPARFLALRTLKAEVCVGVPDAVAERARAVDREWLVSGRFGVAQLSSGV